MGVNDRVVIITDHPGDDYVRLTFRTQLFVDTRAAIHGIESSKLFATEDFDCSNFSKPRQTHSRSMLAADDSSGTVSPASISQ